MSARVIEEDYKTRRWTLSEYLSMAEMGLFEGQRVELIEGEIIVMSPHGSPHVYSIESLVEVLRKAFGGEYWIRAQYQLNLNNRSAPEPDVSVVKGTFRDYMDHPTTAILVVEVSWSTLRLDRQKKSQLYAKEGIEEYWIVNLLERKLEVHRKPGKDKTGKFIYKNVLILSPGEIISPLAMPASKIALDDILPPEKMMKNRN